ncbi:MAG: hypothetical protein QOD32_527 [Pyrinomonadaceae bacterium]|jgi:uncharacterized membrane protein|nr:hypothetical protein [Pyrinomonadaceae bacterium]
MATSETALTQEQIDRGEAPQGYTRDVNVGEIERWASAIGGGALAVYGLTRGSYGGIALALLGASLVHRGATGHCYAYDAAGVNTAKAEGDNPFVSVEGGRGVKVEKSVTINKSPGELYNFWLNFENLPRFMNHLEEVRVTGDGRSHWVAKGPAGTRVEWDAESYNLVENEIIAWRSLEGSQVANAGSVHFTPAPEGRGTEVRVVLKYDPPAGVLGAWVAKLFGEAPEQQIAEDLGRFKQLMEAGETATVTGQTSGRSAKA